MRLIKRQILSLHKMCIRDRIHAWLVEKGDGEAVIESFLPQILEIARTHTGKGVLFGDLVQEGNIGLLEAMAIYQGKDAEGFLAHAKSAVEDSILDAVSYTHLSKKINKIRVENIDEKQNFAYNITLTKKKSCGF